MNTGSKIRQKINECEMISEYIMCQGRENPVYFSIFAEVMREKLEEELNKETGHSEGLNNNTLRDEPVTQSSSSNAVGGQQQNHVENTSSLNLVADQMPEDLSGSKLSITTEQGENAQTPFQIQLPFYSFPSTHNVEEQIQVQPIPQDSSAQIVNLGNTSPATGTPIFYYSLF